jgi:hypothetical protein
MTKNATRREQFRALGAKITATESNLSAWKDATGQHRGEWQGRAIQDPALSSRTPGGPQTKSMQWERTNR